jgi:uridine phosphorylase
MNNEHDGSSAATSQASRASAQGEVLADYRYRDNVPARGLLIDGRPALTGIDPQLVGDYVMLFVRDPLCAYEEDPATRLARRLDSPQSIGRGGMFTSWSGRYKDARITAISGGSGSPEAELCMYELLEHTEASTYLRVGGSGALSAHVHPGDVVIATGIVRADGLTSAYVEPGWPAVCSPDLVLALTQAAVQLNVRHHIGLTRSSASDLCGAGRPSVGGYMRPEQAQLVDECRRSGVLNGEREAAAIVTMATLFGRRAGACCSVADNIVTGERFVAGAGHTDAVDIALEGVAILAQMDRIRGHHACSTWLPSMSIDEATPGPADATRPHRGSKL